MKDKKRWIIHVADFCFEERKNGREELRNKIIFKKNKNKKETKISNKRERRRQADEEKENVLSMLSKKKKHSSKQSVRRCHADGIDCRSSHSGLLSVSSFGDVFSVCPDFQTDDQTAV